MAAFRFWWCLAMQKVLAFTMLVVAQHQGIAMQLLVLVCVKLAEWF